MTRRTAGIHRGWRVLAAAAGVLTVATAGTAHADPGDDSRDCQASARPPQGDGAAQTNPSLPRDLGSGLRSDTNTGNCVITIIMPPH